MEEIEEMYNTKNGCLYDDYFNEDERIEIGRAIFQIEELMEQYEDTI